MSLESLQKKLRVFSQERDWDQFHSPKNLVMALSGEVGELNEIFQWLGEKASFIGPEHEEREAVEDEMADIFLYLLRLADRLELDLEAAATKKIEKNGIKYPVEKSKGLATKYSRLR